MADMIFLSGKDKSARILAVFGAFWTLPEQKISRSDGHPE
jgi:hypothetical protein